MLLKRRDFFAILFLILILCFLFYNSLFLGRMFYFRDLFHLHFPIKKLSIDIVKNGSLPFWNPYQSFGQPLLANPNYVNFHPINLLFLFLPFDFAFSLSIILHFFLAGFFFYLLARDFNLKVGSSLLGSLIFMLSGNILSLGNLYNALATTAWLPLTFLLYRRGLMKRNFLYFMGTSLSIAVQFLGGEPVSLCLTLFLLFIYSLFYAKSSEESLKLRLKSLVYLGIVGMVALMLVMVQLLPFLRLLLNSHRWEGLSYNVVNIWSLNPLRLFELFIPQMFGNSTNLYYIEFIGQSFFDNGYPFIMSIYLGILPLLFVLAVFFLRWNRETRFWTILFGISLLLSFGSYLPFHHSLHKLIPLLKMFRFPIKIFALVTFSLAILAAFGVESLIYQEKRERKPSCWKKKTKYLLISSLLFLFIFLFIFLWMIVSPSGFKVVLGKTYLAGQHSEELLQKAYQVFKAKYLRSLAFFFFSVIIMLLILSPKLAIGLKLILAVFCILLDVLPFAIEINPTAHKELFYHPPTVAQYLSQHKEYFRIYRSQRSQDVFLNLPDPSIKWAYYWDKQVLARYYAVLYKISYGFDINIGLLNSASYIKFVTFCDNQPTALKMKLMGLGNIKYILSLEHIDDANLFPVAEIFTGSNVTLKVYQNLLCMPRVYLAEKGVWARGEDEAMRIMLQPEFNPQQMVLLSGKGKRLESLSADEEQIGSCRIVSYGPNKVVIEAETEKDCYLVLADSFYQGWQVEIDGRKGEILPANVLFRAVRLTEGKHKIIFFYRPSLFYFGLLISLVSLVTSISFSILKIRRKVSIKDEEKKN